MPIIGRSPSQSRAHTTIAALFVTQNAYPREAFAEAVLRFVEEDLEAPRDATSASARNR